MNASGNGSQQSSVPGLSIVVPAWNRAATIERCLNSILEQDFTDFELLVVDDASEDDTVAVVERYCDPRIRIIRKEVNGGVCAARATGTEHARAEWVLYVDSDDALEPGLLRKLKSRIESAPEDVGLLAFSYLHEDGLPSPRPPFPDEPFGADQYLANEDLRTRQPGPRDFLYAIRRRCALDVGWPKDRCFETTFFLPLVFTCRFWISKEIGGRVYADAPNRYSTSRSDGERARVTATDNARAYARILHDFSEPLSRFSPRWYTMLLRICGIWHFRAGRRLHGAWYMLRHLWRRPNLQAAAIVAVGLLSPSVLSKLAHRAKRRSWRNNQHAAHDRGAGTPMAE